MDSEILQTVFQGFSTLALLAGAAWAVFRINVERTYAPQIEFTIDAQLAPLSGSNLAAEYILTFHNKGKTRVQINRIGLWVRGVKSGEEATFLENNTSALRFPHVITDVENIIPKDFGYIFFEPGIRQDFRFISAIPIGFSPILIHGEFYYDELNPHTAQKLVNLAGPTPAGAS